MEHVIKSEVSGVVRELALEVGDTIFESTPIMFIEPLDVEGEYDSGESQDLDEIRPDVAEVNHFHELTRDDSRVEAAEKRHEAGKRTARENILDLCDDGSFLNMGLWLQQLDTGTIQPKSLRSVLSERLLMRWSWV